MFCYVYQVIQEKERHIRLKTPRRVLFGRESRLFKFPCILKPSASYLYAQDRRMLQMLCFDALSKGFGKRDTSRELMLFSAREPGLTEDEFNSELLFFRKM